MRYIKLFEEMTDMPQIGDYVMINTYAYFRRIAVVKRFVHDYEPEIMIEVQLGNLTMKLFLKDIKCWGKTIDDVIKNAEEVEKDKKKLGKRLSYNLNKFFDYKTLLNGKIPKFNIVKDDNIKVKYEEGEDPLRVIIPSIYLYYDGVFQKLSTYSRLQIYSDKMKEMGLKRNTQDEFYSYNSIRFNKEEAEELLRSIKVEFPMRVVEKEAEKYNM